MKFRPLGTNVLVEQHAPGASQGGILFPEDFVVDATRGVVVEAGPDCKRKLKVGDRVHYEKGEGAEVVFNGKKHRIVDEKHVLGKFEEDKPAPVKDAVPVSPPSE